MGFVKPNKTLKHHKVALLIVDMLNTFDFPERKKLTKFAEPVAENILRLKNRLAKRNVPIIYLNDNFGRWKSDRNEIFQICTEQGCIGKTVAEILEPTPSDYFILKPRHSGFYCTNLDILLEDLGVEKLIITGVAGNICVFFTVNDAHMRDYKIWVPKDTVASNTKKDNQYALDQMKSVLGVSIRDSSEGLENFLEKR